MNPSMEPQAFGAGRAGSAFDPIEFIKKPQVIVRLVAWVNRRKTSSTVDTSFSLGFRHYCIRLYRPRRYLEQSMRLQQFERVRLRHCHRCFGLSLEHGFHGSGRLFSEYFEHQNA